MADSPASLVWPKAKNRREWPRYEAEKSFSLTASVDGRVVFCTVEDVSLGGAKLLFDDAIPAGQALALSHADGRAVSCARVWQDGHSVGIEFDFSEDALGLISICIRNMIDLNHQPLAASA